jgi:Protein of unknown function (DUF3072)
MMATKKTAQDPTAAKDPRDWVTGDEPMTGPQESYLDTLGREAGERVSEDLTKAEASKKIQELQEKTGRGKSARRKRTTPKKG